MATACCAKIEPDRVRLITRNGHDWTAKLTHLAKSLRAMKLKPGWLDGEIVVPNDKGGTSFQELQNAFESARTADIVYYLFDVPYYDGHDLTRVPLIERRRLLESVIGKAQRLDPVQRRVRGEPRRPRHLGVPARARGHHRQAEGQRLQLAPFARLDQAQVRPSTGVRHRRLDRSEGQSLGPRLAAARRARCGRQARLCRQGRQRLRRPFARLGARAAREGGGHRPAPLPRSVPDARGAHWVKPKLVAEVTFSEWTGGGHLRHPVFHALRSRQAGEVDRARGSGRPARARRRGAGSRRFRPGFACPTPSASSTRRAASPRSRSFATTHWSAS